METQQSTLFLDFQETLTREVGPELSRNFSEGLMNVTSGNIDKGARFFYQLGKAWGPLMRNWATWVTHKTQDKNIALILRDAKPLEMIDTTQEWHRLYLNRKNCGISDEISGDDTSMHPLLKEYLDQYNCSQGFTFVDSGCYGSIVLELHRIGVNLNPLFFFSKNPHIPGYLNELGVDEETGTILNDSLECAFPNIYNRPQEFISEGGKIVVKLSHADELSIRFGRAALQGIKDSCMLDERKSLEKILKLLERSQKGDFTGIFQSPSPEWSQKKEFLDNWPKTLHWD